VIFVYLPGSTTEFFNFGPAATDTWTTVGVLRDSPTSWKAQVNGYTWWTIGGLGGGYLADIATGNESLMYSGQAFALRIYGYTGVDPNYVTVFGVRVNGVPGGWAVHDTHSSPFFGTWYAGMWVNGVDGTGTW
jgi:hypothetical protein